ncbi:MAG TPA: glycosyltransferase [Blastocatellia bacterium]|nr:glycosyltransferase [Blastocatellia bacterium]
MLATVNRQISVSKRWQVLQIGKYYPPFFGGMESHLQNLCRNLRESVDVEVIVANHGTRKQETVYETIDGLQIMRAGTKMNLAATPICPSMFRAIRQSKADVVHLHWPNPMAALAYLASRHKGALVVTYHSDVIRQKILAKVFDPILHQLLDRATAIIATSPNYIESSPILMQYRDRCHVVPFGIPVEQFQKRNDVAVARLRKKYGHRIILTVGRLVYYKGIEYLIRAMAHVKGHLLIIGDGPLREPLRREAKLCRVADRVTFLGQVRDEELVNFYYASDIFTLPSIMRSEAFGIVQLEAMACGKPVVNTQLDSGVPFVSRGGETGFTVPTRDPAALASALTTLLNNSSLRNEFGFAARQRVLTEFSEEVMIQRVFDVYKQVLPQRYAEALRVVLETAGS